jgi:hypothetical protein
MYTINMRKSILFSIVLCVFSFYSAAQEVGDIREIKLVLLDMPISGDAIQTNFMATDYSESISFNHINWQDKHWSLFDFYHTFKDTCQKSNLQFAVTMIYIPLSVYTYVRYEGYVPTGIVEKTWVLTSIVKVEGE